MEIQDTIHRSVTEEIQARYFTSPISQTAAGLATIEDTYPVNQDLYSSYATLSRLYEQNILGIHHANQIPRYMQRYPYNPNDNFAQAVEDLGDDIHPVKHMAYTHDHVTIPYIMGELLTGKELDPEDIHTLRLAAMTHDMGECTHDSLGDTTGDIGLGDHTDKDKLIEAGVWDKVITRTGIRPLLPRSAIPVLRAIVMNAEDSAIGAAFEIIERTGYYITAAEAAYHALLADGRTKRARMLARLAIDVENNHKEFILDSGTYFPRLVVAKLDPLHDELKRRQASLSKNSRNSL
jgi:hypothetical protein